MHAYLIIAHTNWRQLQKLVTLIDDERNDIYIHIDKKSNISGLHLSTRFSKLVFVDRKNVYWGDVSLINIELTLFLTAFVGGGKTGYSYYHLLSGLDLPLHNQDYIHQFFEQHAGKEFIGFGKKNWDVRNRVYCHNFFMHYMRYDVDPVRCILKILRIALNKLQVGLNFNVQKNRDVCFRYGANWVSVTHNFVTELLKLKDEILTMYKYSYCPDEIYKQTFAFNSQFRDKVFDLEDEFHGCMREIDWNRGCPYIWHTDDDYNYLSQSYRLFARKFDYNKYPKIVDRLIEKISNEEY